MLNLVNCKVVRLVAFDEVLGLFFGGMVGVTLEFLIGNDFLHKSAANSTCFRVPGYTIATFEHL